MIDLWSVGLGAVLGLIVGSVLVSTLLNPKLDSIRADIKKTRFAWSQERWALTAELEEERARWHILREWADTLYDIDTLDARTSLDIVNMIDFKVSSLSPDSALYDPHLLRPEASLLPIPVGGYANPSVMKRALKEAAHGMREATPEEDVS